MAIGTKTSLKKRSRTASNFFRAYSSSFNSSNVCNFCWSWILKDCIKERKSLSCVQVSTKREIRHFHVVVVQWQQRNVPKSVMHVQSCCFAHLNLFLFCCSRWSRRRRCFCYGQKDATLLANNSQHCWMLLVVPFCTLGPANRERQEVTWPGPCRQVCGLRFTFVRLDPAPEISDLPQGFFGP